MSSRCRNGRARLTRRAEPRRCTDAGDLQQSHALPLRLPSARPLGAMVEKRAEALVHQAGGVGQLGQIEIAADVDLDQHRAALGRRDVPGLHAQAGKRPGRHSNGLRIPS